MSGLTSEHSSGHRPVQRLRWHLGVVAALSLSGVTVSGCASGPVLREPCGFLVGCGDINESWRQRRSLQQRRETGTQSEAVQAGAQEEARTRAVSRYMDFIRDQEEQWERGRPTEEEKRRELWVLLELRQWALSQSEAELRSSNNGCSRYGPCRRTGR
jgi:hypothetical protein